MEYEEVVKMIEESEKRVDEVLKAAKLSRCPREPMSKDKLEMILDHVLMLAGILIGGALLFSFFYFMSR